MMFTFSVFNFVIAGGLAAAVVAAVHLWQRQRPRTLEWAAMDFLQQAITKRRRWLRLRDLLLMLLRCLCVLLLGLALADPRTTSEQAKEAGNVPVHAIFLLDNSLSMAQLSATGTRLDQAKSEATVAAERFAAGSRFTLVQLCAPENNHLLTAGGSIEEFREALARIEPVDDALDVTQIDERIVRGRELLPDWPQVAIVISDRQARNFSPEVLKAWRGEQPLYWIAAGSAAPTNSAVTAIQLREPALTPGGAAHLTAEIAHWGDSPRRSAQLILRIDGTDVATRLVDLAANQTTSVPFAFTVPESSGPADRDHALLEIRLAADDLPYDDVRYLWAPLRENMKVILVDQFGTREDSGTNRYGETYPLRRLIATRNPLGENQLFDVRHLALDQVDASALEEAQLVVVAGVADPAPAAGALQEYVRSGGMLWIAAGGDFTPAGWRGLLPSDARLTELHGALPEAASGPLEVRRIDVASLSDELAALPGLSRRQVAQLLRQPIFFRTAVMELPSPAENQATVEAPAERLQILARFDDGTPLLVQQSLGEGRIWWMTSGLFPEWNTIALGNGLVFLEHLFDLLLRGTLPDRNWPTMTALDVPLEGAVLESHYDVAVPGGETIPLARTGRAIIVPPQTERGVVSIYAPEGMSDEASAAPIAQAVVNGPIGESDLRELSPEQLAERWQELPIELVTSLNQIEATAGSAAPHRWWRWFALAMLALLLTELALLALPTVRGEEQSA